MHLVVDEAGSFIGKRSERLRVYKAKELIQEVPLIKLEAVLVAADGVSLSSDAIKLATERGIPISFISDQGEPYASIFSSALTGTILTRRGQLLAYEDERGVALAKSFAQGKLLNQANLIKYMAKYRKKVDLALHEEVRSLATDIEALADEVEKVEGKRIDELRVTLMNREAQGAKLYWQAIERLLLSELEWPGRKGRGASDPINSCLNYGYGILYGQMERAILLAGLDPYAGFLHADRSGKLSLVFDLIEEFRQAIVDRSIFGMLNKGTPVATDEEGRLELEMRRLIAEKVFERLGGQERYGGERQELRFIIQAQARQMASFLRREREKYEPFVAGW